MTAAVTAAAAIAVVYGGGSERGGSECGGGTAAVWRSDQVLREGGECGQSSTMRRLHGKRK